MAYEGKIYRKEDACNKGIDYMAVVFSAFPNGIENQKSYKRNRKRIDKKQPPVRFKKPAYYINKERKSPYSGNCNGGYNLAAKTSFGFFETFGFFPTVVGIEDIINGNAENFAHFFKNISIGNSLGPFPF